MACLDRPFVGSEAIAMGLVGKHQLRAGFQAVYPDVYVPKNAVLTLSQHARAGWLWSHRQGVIAGLTASGLHGAKWIDTASPVELIWPNARAPRGLRTYDMRLRSDEFGELDGMRVTTPERTAFDIGRRGGLVEAVARLDALSNATGVKAEDVLEIADRYRGARGLRQLRIALDLFDAGAASPKETWLRLLLIRAGYPRPQTQIPVVTADGARYYLDMGWPDIKVAVEYDGDQHRSDRGQYVKDIRRLDAVQELGWTMVRVISEHRPAEILSRVQRAWTRMRGDREIS
jgi:hypothetical protein